jgi:hypothetical protein
MGSWIGMVLISAMLPAGLGAENAPSGTGWLSEWSTQLGIELESTPSPDEPFSELKAKIVSPEDAVKLLGPVEADAEVLIRFAGNVAWTVEVEGRRIRPATLKVQVAGREGETTLVPDRSTRRLRPAPPPFRGSRRASED